MPVTIVVRAPAPMLRRGLALTAMPAIAVEREEDARHGAGELAARGRAVEGPEGETRAGGGGPTVLREGARVYGLGRQGGLARVASSLSRVESRREMLEGRLGAVGEADRMSADPGAAGEGAAAVVEPKRATYRTASGPGCGTRAVRAEGKVEVAAARGIGVGGEAERVTGGAAVQRELRVREMNREGEVAGQRRVAQRRQRRVEIEADEDLRLELVR